MATHRTGWAGTRRWTAAIGIESGVASLARAGVLAACIALGACTTVGVHTGERFTQEYGPPVQMRVCVLRTEGVSPERVDALIAAVNREFTTYGIEVVVPWIRPWARTGFTHQRVFDDVVGRDLEAPCDRLVAFVDRNPADVLWGMLMPEVLGSVEEVTHTHAYIVATRASFNQLFMPPEKSTIHEFYHLLGCPHSGSLSKCYTRIAALKRQFDPEADFLPGIGGDGRFLLTRAATNAALRRATGRIEPLAGTSAIAVQRPGARAASGSGAGLGDP